MSLFGLGQKCPQTKKATHWCHQAFQVAKVYSRCHLFNLITIWDIVSPVTYFENGVECQAWLAALMSSHLSMVAMDEAVTVLRVNNHISCVRYSFAVVVRPRQRSG